VVSRNRAVVDELIELMNQRERRPTHLFHPDIEWHWSESTPGASLYRGHEELDEGLDAWTESWEELAIEPKEVLEDAEKARRRFLAGDRPE
jgi:hypothetical protein